MRLSAISLLLWLVAQPAIAQSLHVPAGYEAAQPTVVSGEPDALREAVLAIERGDRRAARTLLRERLREDRSPRIRLLRASLDLDVAPQLVLAMSDADADGALRELSAIRAEAMAGLALGIVGAVTGGISAILAIVGAIVTAVPTCTGIPVLTTFECRSNAQAGSALLTAGAVMGGVASASTITAIALTVSSGERRGTFVERIRTGAFTSDGDAGAYVSVEGAM